MGTAPLTDADRVQLSARADEFHAALLRGAVGDWERFLAGLPAHVRPAVLDELVIIDLAHRWGRGERPTVEEYVARFPEFGPVGRVPAAVVLEEHRCRMKAGEKPDPDGFRARFPEQYPQIAGEVESGRGGTVAGSVVSTIASADGGAAVARRLTPEAEDYEFQRVIGRGVFGEVWLARKKTSGIEKAIKILLQASDQEAAERERRALELVKNLSRHPYLLSTEDFWMADNRLHIVMELADCTLRTRMARCREAGRPGIPPDELVGYLREAADGLDFLHAQKIVHRDVKPDNILLVHGHAKVADFGLARYQEEVLGPMRTFAGTPAYMAPEMWGKEGGPASDQYSLAVTYAELRQGRPPVRPQPIPDMLLAHDRGDYEFTDAIGPDERAVILRGLAHDPAARYPSCRAFSDAVAAALGLPGVPRSGFAPADASPELNASAAVTEPDSHAVHPGADTATEPPDTAVLVEVGPPPVSRRAWWGAAALVVGGLAVGLGLGAWGRFGGTGGNGVPDADTGWHPPGTTPAAGAKPVQLASGRRVYDVVEGRVGNETVRYRLVTAENGPPVRPFHVMESKVWNGLYRSAGLTPHPESEVHGPGAPVTHVTREDAEKFAAAVGGRLPTPDEWDHAAGLYAAPKDQKTVTLPGGRPHVNAPTPRPTHGPGADGDVNHYSLRDMAGNGREWTRGSLKTEGGEEMAVVRGRAFTTDGGLTFEHLREQQAAPHTQRPQVGSPYTGLRVVLPGE